MDATTRTSAIEQQRLEVRWWQPPFEFLLHSFVGTLIFAIIAIPAVGLNLATHYLTSRGVDKAVVVAVCIAEYALLLSDLALFVVFLWRAARRAGKKF